jgi:hypothetical protein
MRQCDNFIYSRICRFSAFLCVCLAAIAYAQAASALSRAELYQATVPLADRSDAAQSTAFQSALKIVLVRVTGSRGAETEPAFAPLLGNARRYVQQYRAAQDNQLWVAFDGTALERWLTQNGQPLWGHDRPATFVWLDVQTGPQAGTVVSTDDVSELKSAIEAAAIVRGIPLIWPTAADLERVHVDHAHFNGVTTASLAEVAHSRGADGVLIGRASGSNDTANVRWTQLYQDRSSEYSGTLEGINRMADTYAALFAASGSLAPIDIEVSGVTDLKDYASVQAYLESLTFISHVSVQELHGDHISFRLSSRGGVEPLQRALELNGRLQSLPAGDNGIQRFQLRP